MKQFNCRANLILDVSKTYGYAREPVLARMGDGSLICTFLSGGHTEPENQNITLVTRSYDDGLTWSDPQVLFYHRKRAAYTTEIFTGAEKPMMFVHTYAAESRYREICTFLSVSDDNGKTWSEPVSLPGAASHVNVRKGIVLSNGKWLFPVYWQEVRERWDWEQIPTSNEIHNHWPSCCGVLHGEKNGTCFKESGYLTSPYVLMENNCVEAEAGHVIMLMRAQGCTELYRSDSFDYGETWQDAYPCGIPSASSKITLLSRKGKILLIHNACAETESMEGRKNLSIWVSEDGMHSWSTKYKLMAQDESMFYPHAFLDEERKAVYIACENTRQSYCLRVPFSELWDE